MNEPSALSFLGGLVAFAVVVSMVYLADEVVRRRFRRRRRVGDRYVRISADTSGFEAGVARAASRLRCPGLPGDPPGLCGHAPAPGDRYCPSHRAEFDSRADSDESW